MGFSGQCGGQPVANIQAGHRRYIDSVYAVQQGIIADNIVDILIDNIVGNLVASLIASLIVNLMRNIVASIINIILGG